MKPKTKKRNPADTTMRNIHSLKKRMDKLEDRHNGIMQTLKGLLLDIAGLWERLRK